MSTANGEKRKCTSKTQRRLQSQFPYAKNRPVTVFCRGPCYSFMARETFWYDSRQTYICGACNVRRRKHSGQSVRDRPVDEAAAA
jgi:hypothetical protein